MIYALGGGLGHLHRGLVLLQRFEGATLLHQGPPTPGTVQWLDPTPDQVVQRLQQADRVVVDVFPGGIGHELPTLDAHTILVARYLRRDAYPRYDALVERFDEVWLPYDAHRCEWEDPPPGRFVGPLHREVVVEDREVDLLVIGHGEPPAWTPLLEQGTRIDGPFTSLPHARRVVALQCGYNLAWELQALGTPCAFRPLPRRFDCQFRRAALLGAPLLHRRDLVRFLDRTGQRASPAVESLA